MRVVHLHLQFAISSWVVHAGQSADWRGQHKLVCKSYNNFIVTGEWQTLEPHHRADALLLSHLLLAILSSGERSHARSRDLNVLSTNQLECYMDLLPSNATRQPIPSMGPPGSELLANALHSRFSNNNFLLQSHLNPAYAHGAYPLASRTLNHSCVPNSAPRFVLEEGKKPRMDVVALNIIDRDQEVCTPPRERQLK